MFHFTTTLLWLVISTYCVPLFAVGLLLWGIPPMIPAWSSYCRYFTATVTEGKPEENIPVTNRVLVFLIVLNSLIKVPIHGLCWYIDELLYPSYHKVNIEEPVFMITAPRSGSTQLCDYLQVDTENFIAPTALEGTFPYIWIWKLFAKVRSQKHFCKNLFGREASKRHQLVMSKPNTWDTIFRSWYFGFCCCCLGTSFMRWAYVYARLQKPVNDDLIRSFMPFTDSIMKKVMYYRGNPKQHMLLKGHFIINTSNIEQQYPKAKLFVVVRNPVDRLSSFVNLIKVLDEETKVNNGLFPPTWKVIRNYVVSTQLPYCEQEMSFYKELSNNKLVIPFTMYVNNLSATLQCIYSFCNIPIPDGVVSNAVRIQHTTHDYTKLRASYDHHYNKSLASLGVDEDRLREYLSEYIEWINNLEKSMEY